MSKIYYTEGPASKEITGDLFSAGANGIRLTFSYSTPEYQLERARSALATAKTLKKQIFVIADLEGGGARLGEINYNENQSFPVVKDEIIDIVNAQKTLITDRKKLPVPDKGVYEALKVGDVLILGDGNASLEVVQSGDSLAVKSRFDAVVEGRRGLFVQADNFAPACMTAKDWRDLEHISVHDEYDAVAISFVSTPEDVLKVKQILVDAGGSHQIIAKIETKNGVENIDEITKVADQIMVARGDLAYAFPWQEMPRAVDKIVAACKVNKKPFIMATQVAESMVHGNMMTRAEMTDLWHWKIEGMDGVLISRETAWGERPLDTIASIQSLLNVAQ